MELSALDGFSQDFIVRLRPFISLEYAPELDGWASNELTGRTSLRASSDVVRYGYATRYKFKYGERLSLSLASSRSLDALNAIPDAVLVFYQTAVWNYSIVIIYRKRTFDRSGC